MCSFITFFTVYIDIVSFHKLFCDRFVINITRILFQKMLLYRRIFDYANEGCAERLLRPCFLRKYVDRVST